MQEHGSPLIATIAAGLVLAFGFGLLAHRLRISPLVGYLLAGIVVGPFTPGFVADQGLADQLAEIGVILLLFAVGLHFSLADLAAVRRTALPGALMQLSISTLLGIALAWALGWRVEAGVLFGLALACASTVVLTRSLQEHRLLETDRGRIAIGWVIVQDVAMVLALVLVPALGRDDSGDTSWSHLLIAFGITIAKVVAFVAIMLIVGRRVVPRVLHYAAHTGSRELFRLSVYAVALGIAYGAAELFGISFAIGAFFAGMVLAESPLSQRATEEALPLRDAFAVIVGGNGLGAFMAMRLLGQASPTALTVGAGLAQIGEFSFILAGLGAGMGLLPPEGRDLILAGAILSILLNPFLFAVVERGQVRVLPGSKRPARPVLPKPTSAHAAMTQAVVAHSALSHTSLAQAARARTAPIPAPRKPMPVPEHPATATSLVGHDVVVGYGGVGALLGRDLAAAGRPVLVFEERDAAIEEAGADGAEVVGGNAADPEILAAANLPQARRLFVTIGETFEAGQVVQQARAANPKLSIVVRAHSDAEVEYFAGLGADLTVRGEREIAYRMIEWARRGLAPQT